MPFIYHLCLCTDLGQRNLNLARELRLPADIWEVVVHAGEPH